MLEYHRVSLVAFARQDCRAPTACHRPLSHEQKRDFATESTSSASSCSIRHEMTTRFAVTDSGSTSRIITELDNCHELPRLRASGASPLCSRVYSTAPKLPVSLTAFKMCQCWCATALTADTLFRLAQISNMLFAVLKGSCKPAVRARPVMSPEQRTLCRSLLFLETMLQGLGCSAGQDDSALTYTCFWRSTLPHYSAGKSLRTCC